MKTPLVTVLVPAYNAGRFIGPVIRSVLSQTLGDFELLIIDDGSVDDTQREVALFMDPRIRFLSNSQNLGVVRTRNRGVEKARGKYIACLDADDFCYPTRLAEQVNLLEHDEDVGLVASWTEVIDENGRTKSFGMWHLSPEAIYYVLHFRQCLTQSSAMFRTTLVRNLGGYSERAANGTEDFDLWHRISQVRKIVQVPKVLVKWREHSGSITGRRLEKMQRTAFRLAEKYIQEITGETWPSEIVEALVECRSVRKLQRELLSDFPARLRKVQESIVRAAPEMYDCQQLRAYIEIETAKYAHILRGLGKSFPLAVPARATLLGFMYYLSSYHRFPLLSRFVAKSHF